MIQKNFPKLLQKYLGHVLKNLLKHMALKDSHKMNRGMFFYYLCISHLRIMRFGRINTRLCVDDLWTIVVNGFD